MNWYRISIIFNPATDIISTKLSLITRLVGIKHVKNVVWNNTTISTTKTEEDINVKVKKRHLYLVKRILREYTEDEIMYKIYEIR